MFNNKFLKHDPLLEAVKGARAEGDLRRKAEALVNEEFGVYSRKAVVREELAAYDARLEEAYKCMKEGKPLADKDYDKDGKIESGKAEYQGSRIRAAKMAGKMEEEQIDEISKKLAVKTYIDREKKNAADFHGYNDEPEHERKARESERRIVKKFGQKTADRANKTVKKFYEEETQIDELSRTTLKSYVKKADRQANRIEDKVRAYKDKPGEEEKMYNRIAGANLARDKMKVRVAASEEVDYSAQDRAPVTKSAPKEDPSLPKEYPGAASSAPTAARLSNAKAAVTPIKEDEQLDELKQATIRSYVDKAHARATAAKASGFKKDFTEKKGKKAAGARDEFAKRTKGLGMAGKKLAEEEQIDEISKELAGKYIKHADYKRSESSFQSGKVYGKELATKKRTKQDVETARKHNRDSYKREKGVNMAVNKLTGRAKVQANEAMMESIKAKLAKKYVKEDQSF